MAALSNQQMGNWFSSATSLPGLVDVLQGLKGQDGGADLARLAIPDQFHLPLVRKQQEAVFLRQGLPLLDELDEITLLSLGEVVVFGRGAGHGGKEEG